MEVLKKGSRGSSVKELQKLLKIANADGIFGSQTESVLKAYQKAHNLTPDGICGKATWTVLYSENKCVDDSVVYLPLSVHITPSTNRPITYLVIHFTGGSNSKNGRARGVKKTFESRQASADFAVDDDEMVQFNPDLRNYYCWSVGGSNYNNKGGKLYGVARNKNCINIEICSTCVPSTQTAVNVDNHSGWSFTDKALENARKLARILMNRYDIPIDKVIRHYDVTGKLCPGIIGWNDEPIKDLNGKKTGETNNSDKWLEFKKSL